MIFLRSVFLSIGSNLSPQKNIPACIQLLKEKFDGATFSSVYETKPVGPAGNKNFWNLAAEIKTDLSAAALSTELRKVEAALGRQRNQTDKFAPRTIDLDILPQPGYQKMGFIMIPLAEIAPGSKDPESGKTFAELAAPLLKETEAFRKIIL
mgnify:CR=1 FL=1